MPMETIFAFHAIVFLMARLITFVMLLLANVNAIKVYMEISAMLAHINLLN